MNSHPNSSSILSGPLSGLKSRAAHGFALVSTMLLLSAIMILVVAYFSMTRSETVSARSYAHDHRAQLAALAGFEEAKGVIAQMTKDDEYLVTAIPNKSTYSSDPNNAAANDSDPDDDSQGRYFFISRPLASGNYEHIPLYSGAKVQNTTIHEGPRWDSAKNSSLEEARGVLGGLRQFGLEDDQFGIDTDEDGTEDDTDQRGYFFKAYTYWVAKDSDGDGEADIRYTWWVEDMQGQPQFDKIGNIYSGGTENSTSTYWNTFQQGSNGHSQNALNSSGRNQAHYDNYRLGTNPYDSRLGTVGDPADNYRLPSYPRKDPEEALNAAAYDRRGVKFPEQSYNPHDYRHDPDDRDIPRQEFYIRNLLNIAEDRDYCYPNGEWTPQIATGLSPKEMRVTARHGGGNNYFTHSYRERRMGRVGGIVSSASAGIVETNRQDRSSYGCRPYIVRPMIPQGFGYKQTGPRENLNKYVTASSIPALVQYMSETLPEGWAKRGGAYRQDPDEIPPGDAAKFGGEEVDRKLDYLKALATNMVDYVDQDNRPTLQRNGEQFQGTGLTGFKQNSLLRNWDRPDARGIDGYPVVNEFYLQVKWAERTEDQNGAGDPIWKVRIEMTPHVEFWNPTNQKTDLMTLGLVWWETPTDGVTHEIMQHYRVDPFLSIPEIALRMADVDTQGPIVDVEMNGASVAAENDLILWELVGQFAPNEYKAFSYPTVSYLLELPRPQVETFPGSRIFVNAIDLNRLRFEGTRDGNEMRGCYDGKYMVLQDTGSLANETDGHTLIDESVRGLYRHGGGNLTIGWGDATKWRYTGNHAAHNVLNYGQALGQFYNPGDPFMSYWMWTRPALVGFEDGSSLGGRNCREKLAEFNENLEERTHTDWVKSTNPYVSTWRVNKDDDDHPGAEVRPERWPDGGYNTFRGRNFSKSEDLSASRLQDRPDSKSSDGVGYTVEDPWEGTVRYNPKSMAPYRLNNTGRWWALSELGNIYDPIMWNCRAWNNGSGYRPFARLGRHNAPSNHGGGGNTLRIGRAEHYPFRQDITGPNAVNPLNENDSANDLHAARLLDIFHVGVNGSNVGRLPRLKETKWNPAFHTDPPTARNALQAASHDYKYVWGRALHAECGFNYVNGHINLNSTQDLDTYWFMTDGPLIMDDGYGIDIPARPYGEVEWQSIMAHRDVIGGMRTRLWRSRPFYSPSQIAMVLFDKQPVPHLDGARSDQWRHSNLEVGTSISPSAHWINPDKIPNSGDEVRVVDRERRNGIPASDAVKEEVFARILNLSTLSSRNFRIHVMGEYLNKKGEPIAASRRVYEVFARPIRNGQGIVTEVKIESLSERDL